MAPKWRFLVLMMCTLLQAADSATLPPPILLPVPNIDLTNANNETVDALIDTLGGYPNGTLTTLVPDLPLASSNDTLGSVAQTNETVDFLSNIIDGNRNDTLTRLVPDIMATSDNTSTVADMGSLVETAAQIGISNETVDALIEKVNKTAIEKGGEQFPDSPDPMGNASYVETVMVDPTNATASDNKTVPLKPPVALPSDVTSNNETNYITGVIPLERDTNITTLDVSNGTVLKNGTAGGAQMNTTERGNKTVSVKPPAVLPSDVTSNNETNDIMGRIPLESDTNITTLDVSKGTIWQNGTAGGGQMESANATLSQISNEVVDVNGTAPDFILDNYPPDFVFPANDSLPSDGFQVNDITRQPDNASLPTKSGSEAQSAVDLPPPPIDIPVLFTETNDTTVIELTPPQMIDIPVATTSQTTADTSFMKSNKTRVDPSETSLMAENTTANQTFDTPANLTMAIKVDEDMGYKNKTDLPSTSRAVKRKTEEISRSTSPPKQTALTTARPQVDFKPELTFEHPPPIFLDGRRPPTYTEDADMFTGPFQQNPWDQPPLVTKPVITEPPPPPPIILPRRQTSPPYRPTRPSTTTTTIQPPLWKPFIDAKTLTPDHDPRYMTVAELAELALQDTKNVQSQKPPGFQVFFNTLHPLTPKPVKTTTPTPFFKRPDVVYQPETIPNRLSLPEPRPIQKPPTQALNTIQLPNQIGQESQTSPGQSQHQYLNWKTQPIWQFPNNLQQNQKQSVQGPNEPTQQQKQPFKQHIQSNKGSSQTQQWQTLPATQNNIQTYLATEPILKQSNLRPPTQPPSAKTFFNSNDLLQQLGLNPSVQQNQPQETKQNWQKQHQQKHSQLQTTQQQLQPQTPKQEQHERNLQHLQMPHEKQHQLSLQQQSQHIQDKRILDQQQPKQDLHPNKKQWQQPQIPQNPVGQKQSEPKSQQQIPHQQQVQQQINEQHWQRPQKQQGLNQGKWQNHEPSVQPSQHQLNQQQWHQMQQKPQPHQQFNQQQLQPQQQPHQQNQQPNQRQELNQQFQLNDHQWQQQEQPNKNQLQNQNQQQLQQQQQPNQNQWQEQNQAQQQPELQQWQPQVQHQTQQQPNQQQWHQQHAQQQQNERKWQQQQQQSQQRPFQQQWQQQQQQRTKDQSNHQQWQQLLQQQWHQQLEQRYEQQWQHRQQAQQQPFQQQLQRPKQQFNQQQSNQQQVQQLQQLQQQQVQQQTNRQPQQQQSPSAKKDSSFTPFVKTDDLYLAQALEAWIKSMKPDVVQQVKNLNMIGDEPKPVNNSPLTTQGRDSDRNILQQPQDRTMAQHRQFVSTAMDRKPSKFGETRSIAQHNTVDSSTGMNQVRPIRHVNRNNFGIVRPREHVYGDGAGSSLQGILPDGNTNSQQGMPERTMVRKPVNLVAPEKNTNVHQVLSDRTIIHPNPNPFNHFQGSVMNPNNGMPTATRTVNDGNFINQPAGQIANSNTNTNDVFQQFPLAKQLAVDSVLPSTDNFNEVASKFNFQPNIITDTGARTHIIPARRIDETGSHWSSKAGNSIKLPSEHVPYFMKPTANENTGTRPLQPMQQLQPIHEQWLTTFPTVTIQSTFPTTTYYHTVGRRILPTTTPIPTVPPTADPNPPPIFDTKVFRTFMPFPKPDDSTRPPVNKSANQGPDGATGNNNNGMEGFDRRCTGCVFVNDRCLLPDDVHCNMYVECVRQGAMVRAFNRECALGSFFDRKSFLCVDPKNTDCPQDRCREPGLKWYPIEGHCKHYWSCASREGGGIYAQSECCPDMGGFVEGVGCAANKNCTESCDSAIITGATTGCSLRKTASPTKYFDANANIERPCAPGTLFNERQCTCEQDVTIERSGTPPGAQACSPMLELTFSNSTVGDSSNNKQHVGIVGIAATQTGEGLFNGAGSLVLWRYANLNFPVVFAVRFRFITASSGPRYQTVISNCDPKGGRQPTFEITLDTLYHEVIFKVDTLESPLKVFKQIYQHGGWTEVVLLYDGERIVGSVDSRARNIIARGGIETRPNPINIGACGKQEGLSGLLDDLTIYEECIPDDMYGIFMSVLE